MEAYNLPLLLFAFIALVAGVGLFFARVDPEQLRSSAHPMPGLALFRFRVYRYGVAAACLLTAAFCIASWAGAF